MPRQNASRDRSSSRRIPTPESAVRVDTIDNPPDPPLCVLHLKRRTLSPPTRGILSSVSVSKEEATTMPKVPDVSVEIVKGFANGIASLVKHMLQGKIRRNNDAAAYFESLAHAMARVREELRAGRIPHDAGHEMERLIHAFPERTKGIYGATASHVIKTKLDEVAKIAKTLDTACLIYLPSVEADRRQMLAQIERIAGDLKGAAGRLKRSNES